MQILIVEDEKKMAAVLKKGLEAENHRVWLAYDGRLTGGIQVYLACCLMRLQKNQ